MFCPLDCWDSCNLELKDGKFKGKNPTFYLCWKLNNYFKFYRETSAWYNGKNIMLSEALNALSNILKNTNPKKVLFIKGSGHMGILQNITKLFFEEYGATFAIGSTCDGIGEKGIKNARGKSLILPTWIIKNAKNIIIWGRNPYVTNIHLLPLIKNKFVVTIDVIKTKTAKNSNFFIQVRPNSDYYLALLLSQFVIEEGKYKSDGNDFEEFKKIVFKYSKQELMEKCGVSKEEINKLLKIIKEGSVVLTGLGVAKCKECYKTTWAIDSLFYMLDYFGKNDRGVAFLGSSSYGLTNPFDIEHKNKIALFDVNLDEFEVVFIQGANPLVSFVNREVWEKLKQKITIVFGKYYDETAKIATLFIPTKDFFEKKDVRGSYFNEYVLVNGKSIPSQGISEYELSKFLYEEFGYGELKSEDEYIKEILNGEFEIKNNKLVELKSQTLEKIGNWVLKKKVFDKSPFKDGFFTEDKKFNFLSEDFDYKEKVFEIVTAKESKALNSQFLRDENIYLNPNSKNIMLNWVMQNFNKEIIKFDKNLPKNVIFSKGGAIINKVLKAKGENAYYEI